MVDVGNDAEVTDERQIHIEIMLAWAQERHKGGEMSTRVRAFFAPETTEGLHIRYEGPPWPLLDALCGYTRMHATQ